MYGVLPACCIGNGYKLFGLTISKWCYQFYLCDYSVGFCSRLLIGAVITHFTDAVSESLMNLIINISVYSTLAIECCASGVIMWTAMKRGSLLGVLFPLLFICNPLTVEFNMGMLGLLDVYLLLLFLIWLCFYRTPFIWIMGHVSEKRKGRIKRILLFMLHPAGAYFGSGNSFSTDIYRWVTFAFIAQFSVFFSLYYDEKSILNEVVKI